MCKFECIQMSPLVFDLGQPQGLPRIVIFPGITAIYYIFNGIAYS
jgi:hypothetical protein